MDTPGETQLVDANSPSHAPPDILPELSRSQLTLHIAESMSHPELMFPDPIPPRPSNKKTSRPRPAPVDDAQDAAQRTPLSPTTTCTPSELRPRTSRMSLFTLFSKPKVEKLRGYAEQGLDGGSSRAFFDNGSLPYVARPTAPLPPLDAPHSILRPSTSSSYATRAARLVSKDSIPGSLNDRDTRCFEPPPLFQVWPQAIKHAHFEVATLASESTSTRKPKNRLMSSTFFSAGTDLQSLHTAGNRNSMENRAPSRPNVRQNSHGSISASKLPMKLFVLVTAGFLLQYAATGATDRYPEKVLQLGKDSAAYASDMIPGKHYVLQIVQSVDQHGVVAPGAHSLLFKMGIRSQNTRRPTSNYLLVMPGADEMDEWMTVIRQEIEKQGGKRARSNSSTRRAQSSDPPRLSIDLRKTPSLSHRYQVRRQLTMADPSCQVTPPLEAHPPPMPRKASSELHEAMHHRTIIRDISPRSRPRAASDAPSSSSSLAASIDHQKLERLRDSIRVSQASTAPTAASSISPIHSAATTPNSDPREGTDAQHDYLTAQTLHRNLASYSLPKKVKKEQQRPPPIALLDRYSQRRSINEAPLDSPILGRTPSTEGPDAHRNKLSPVHSVPNLKNASQKNTSSLPFPVGLDSCDRPESILGDLPDPRMWANMTVPLGKPTLHQSRSMSGLASRRANHKTKEKTLRGNPHSYSIPLLRIRTGDTTTVRAAPSRLSPRFDAVERPLRSPIPAATTLVAKVDCDEKPAPPVVKNSRRASSAEVMTIGQAKRVPPVRLSLLGGTPTMFPVESQRNLSMAFANVGTHDVSAPLKRPASLQVRSDHAPFLASFRAATAVTTQHRSASTPPIRSLKPSRSDNSTPTLSRPPAPAERYNFSTRRVMEEMADQAMPLPRRADSPVRNLNISIAKARKSASLPELDFGLGPPAPPPQTPLPDLPTDGQPASWSGSTHTIRSVRSVSRIGVAIGGSPVEPRSSSPISYGIPVQVGTRA